MTSKNEYFDNELAENSHSAHIANLAHLRSRLRLARVNADTLAMEIRKRQENLADVELSIAIIQDTMKEILDLIRKEP